jgi:hypothetical protein
MPPAARLALPVEASRCAGVVAHDVEFFKHRNVAVEPFLAFAAPCFFFDFRSDDFQDRSEHFQKLPAIWANDSTVPIPLN